METIFCLSYNFNFDGSYDMELDVLIVVVLVMPLYFIINKNLFSDKRDLECFNEINQIKN